MNRSTFYKGGVILNKEQALSFLKEHLTKMNYLNSTLSIVSWDMEVMAPVNAIDYRSEVMGYLSGEYHLLATEAKIKDALDILATEESLTQYEAKLVEHFKESYEKSIKIPQSLQQELTVATSKGSQYWKQAKEQQNYDLFKPYLKRIVELAVKQAECIGYKGHIYNAFLDDFEKGMTVEELDRIFPPLRDGLVELLNKIKSSNQKDGQTHPSGLFDKERQEKLSLMILDAMGYDYKNSGRVDEVEHPFTTTLGPKDVRIMTHYYEDNLESAMFSSIHEGGHAIYEQNMPHELAVYGIDDSPSMGIHESQSRFYENIIGRSLPFWRNFYPKLQAIFPEYKDVSLENFYRLINQVNPSLIRTEADEVTYSLHVIIRYEIEKLLVSHAVEVDELPALWNQKYEEYLGITPQNDSEGVMQDVHWSEALIGYFPSYALGNLYGAQFYHQMKKDIPDIEKQIELGQLSSVYNWLKDRVHAYGNIYTPSELILHVTGEPLNPQYFIDYLNEKYSKIYNF